MTEREVTPEKRCEARKRIAAELLDGTLDIEREANRLAVIGEPTRFTILYLLTKDGRLRSGELADQLDRRQNDLYHHLNTLEEAGLVGKFRDGHSRVYELSPLAEQFVPAVFDSIQKRAETA